MLWDETDLSILSYLRSQFILKLLDIVLWDIKITKYYITVTINEWTTFGY